MTSGIRKMLNDDCVSDSSMKNRRKVNVTNDDAVVSCAVVPS